MPGKISWVFRGSASFYLFLVATVVFLVLLLGNSGLYPAVFGDEYTYSLTSRILPFSASPRPGYLYLLIYRTTNICGEGFLEGARILNALFFVAATPFLYLTARRVCTKNVAAVVTLMALLGPVNSYTAYFMPEALYFFVFWIFTWHIFRQNNCSPAKTWCAGGMLLGLLSLVKPHALFLLPAIVVYIFYISKRKEGKWALQAFWGAGIFAACVFLTKLLIGYALAGKAGLTIFGTDYTTTASSAGSGFQRYVELLTLFAENIKGHILANCLLFGMPIAGALIAVFNPVNHKEKTKADQKVSFYTLAVLFSTVFVTGLFAASIGNSGPYESVARLSMRYYNFTFPLLLVVAAAQLSLGAASSKRRWRLVAALPIGMTILYASYIRMAPYTPNIIDCPELRGFMANSTISYILGGLSFLALIMWVFSAKAGGRCFFYLFMPLAVVFSTFYVTRDLRQHLVPDVFDKAGIFTKQYLPEDEISKVIVIGSEPAGLFRSLFYLDNPRASLETIPKGAVYDLSVLPSDKEWVLLIGDHPLPRNIFFQIPMNGFALARVTAKSTIDFKKSSWGVISRADGLSGAEPWGTWSTGAVITLEFSTPLPEKFTVHLVGSAFGPNIGKEFIAHVGDEAVKFKLAASPEERVLEFNNPKKLKTIQIDIPSPASPKELGMSSDARKLGAGLTELRIVPL